MNKYQLNHTEQKFIAKLEDYPKKNNKCKECGKWYKLPGSIFEPRDEICATCESILSRNEVLMEVMG